jgi:hypothetical protein
MSPADSRGSSELPHAPGGSLEASACAAERSGNRSAGAGTESIDRNACSARVRARICIERTRTIGRRRCSRNGVKDERSRWSRRDRWREERCRRLGSRIRCVAQRAPSGSGNRARRSRSLPGSRSRTAWAAFLQASTGARDREPRRVPLPRSRYRAQAGRSD